MRVTKLSVNERSFEKYVISLPSAQNRRDSVVNFVKIVLLLTFLPTGGSDELGKEPIKTYLFLSNS